MKVSIYLLSCVFLLTSCLNKPEVADAPTQGFEFRSVDQLRQQQTYDNKPHTLTVFFWPKPEDLTWTSTVFSASDDDNTKAKKVALAVTTNGVAAEKLDNKLYLEDKKRAPKVKERDGLLTTAGVASCDLITTQETKEKCTKLNNEIADIDAKKKTYFNKKLSHVQTVLNALDKDPDNNVNWISVNRERSSVKITEDFNDSISLRLKIAFAPGQKEQTYNSSRGDIEDIEYYEDSAKRSVYLKFRILEKDSKRKPTGYAYDVVLKRYFYTTGLGVRFLGSIEKIDLAAPSVVLRKGSMKIVLQTK